MYVCMYFTICRVYFTPVLCIRPLINQKYEEKTCGEGPNLAVMLDDDHWLTSLGRESLVCMYVSACVYVRMYIRRWMAWWKHTYVRMYIQCVALYVRMSVWVYTYIHMCVCVCVPMCGFGMLHMHRERIVLPSLPHDIQPTACSHAGMCGSVI